MKVLIFGSRGWLGGRLIDELKKRGHEVHGSIEDINNVVSINGSVDAAVNCAASTNVDWCEKNREESYKNNVLGAVNLAKVCKQAGKKYVFMSTLCIFNSKGANDIKYEDSIPEPVNFYSQTKAEAEKFIQEIDPDALIFRIRLPLSGVSHPKNTITKILGYDKIVDVQESMTVVEDALSAIVDLMEKREKGIFHLVNEGTISAAEIAELLEHSFTLISLEEHKKMLADAHKAKRPIVYAGSKRIPPLPDIRERMNALVRNYNKNQNLSG